MGKPWENHGKMVIYMEHHHFCMGKLTIFVAIFNSYVELPEGFSFSQMREKKHGETSRQKGC